MGIEKTGVVEIENREFRREELVQILRLLKISPKGFELSPTWGDNLKTLRKSDLSALCRIKF